MLKFKPNRDIPKFALEHKTLSPAKLSEIILTERNKAVKPNSITKWLNRHTEIYNDLQKQIIATELPELEVSESIFRNGTFEEIPAIKNWINELIARGAKTATIKAMCGCIKQICQGKLPHGNLIDYWSLKHPERLTLNDALNYIAELKKKNLESRNHRLALRNFFRSRNIEGWTKISGQIEQMGKYAHLYAEKDKIYKVFEWLKPINKDAYLASKFAFKTACRITATLTAHASKINREEHTIFVEEKATTGKGKRIQEKYIPPDLWGELPKEGKLFNIEEQELNSLLRSAYKEIIPELADSIPMPFHFFRHQFAQHLLRETDWNYGLVARLGHWTVETLERYYGKMDRKTALEGAKKHLPNI